jgi:hypothetical protein
MAKRKLDARRGRLDVPNLRKLKRFVISKRV